MTHVRHHPHTWALIRDDYVAGQPRCVLAERYGVGESTIRDRARREGWCRVDQEPSHGPVEWDEAAEAEPMRPTRAIIADAYRFADLAMRRGRPAEAQRYLSVAKGFERLNRADPLVRGLKEYWADEESMLLDTERLREQWDADLAAAAASAAALQTPPDPPNPPSVSGAADRAAFSTTPEPPNPASPPNVIEAAEEATLPPNAAPAEAEPTADRAEALRRRIAGRKLDRLPFHDLSAELRRVEGPPLTVPSAPLGLSHDHAPARPPELPPLAIAGARDPVRSQTATLVGGPVAHPASDPYPPEPT